LAKQREKSEAAYRENLGKLAVARALEIGELLDPKKQRMIAEGKLVGEKAITEEATRGGQVAVLDATAHGKQLDAAMDQAMIDFGWPEARVNALNNEAGRSGAQAKLFEQQHRFQESFFDELTRQQAAASEKAEADAAIRRQEETGVGPGLGAARVKREQETADLISGQGDVADETAALMEERRTGQFTPGGLVGRERAREDQQLSMLQTEEQARKLGMETEAFKQMRGLAIEGADATPTMRESIAWVTSMLPTMQRMGVANTAANRNFWAMQHYNISQNIQRQQQIGLAKAGSQIAYQQGMLDLRREEARQKATPADEVILGDFANRLKHLRTDQSLAEQLEGLMSGMSDEDKALLGANPEDWKRETNIKIAEQIIALREFNKRMRERNTTPDTDASQNGDVSAGGGLKIGDRVEGSQGTGFIYIGGPEGDRTSYIEDKYGE
jgi:hypothetical protein